MTNSSSAYIDAGSWTLAKEVLAGARMAIRYNKNAAQSLVLAVIHDHLLATSRAHALRLEMDVTLRDLNNACAELPCSRVDTYQMLGRAIEIAEADEPDEAALRAAINLVEHAFRRGARCIAERHVRAA